MKRRSTSTRLHGAIYKNAVNFNPTIFINQIKENRQDGKIYKISLPTSLGESSHKVWQTRPVFEYRPRVFMRWNTNLTFWLRVQFSAIEGSVTYRPSDTLCFILNVLCLALVRFVSDRFSYF
jgi:hypothetical protein